MVLRMYQNAKCQGIPSTSSPENTRKPQIWRNANLRKNLQLMHEQIDVLLIYHVASNYKLSA